MIRTTLTFQDPEKLQEFLSSQQLSHVEAIDSTLTGYLEHNQIEIASEEYGATVLQVEDGKTTSEADGSQEVEPLL